MALYKYGNSSNSPVGPATTEFDILKARHRFLREDKEQNEASWEDQLAKKYYSNLYREYAVCDLKHYKTGNFALRWRTESEVISGAGETTCGNTRCPLHPPNDRDVDYHRRKSSLTTLELPFSYVEDGEGKFALVKVVLCSKCLKKLMWKRNKEKAQEVEAGEGPHGRRTKDPEGTVKEEAAVDEDRVLTTRPSRKSSLDERAYHNSGEEGEIEDRVSSMHVKRRRRNSRSLSPSHARSSARSRPS